MFKQKKITLKEAQKGLAIFQSIPLRYAEADFYNVLKLSKNTKMYAYINEGALKILSWKTIEGVEKEKKAKVGSVSFYDCIIRYTAMPGYCNR